MPQKAGPAKMSETIIKNGQKRDQKIAAVYGFSATVGWANPKYIAERNKNITNVLTTKRAILFLKRSPTRGQPNISFFALVTESTILLFLKNYKCMSTYH